MALGKKMKRNMAQKAFLCRMKRERKTERKVNKQFCTDETKKKRFRSDCDSASGGVGSGSTAV